MWGWLIVLSGLEGLSFRRADCKNENIRRSAGVVPPAFFCTADHYMLSVIY
jgi:hypothetical protein